MYYPSTFGSRSLIAPYLAFGLALTKISLEMSNMSTPCDIDNGQVGQQGAVYYEYDINVGPLVGDTFKEMLKAVTTGVASRYLVEKNISDHYQCIADINTALTNNSLGSIVVKGGLAFRLVLNNLFANWPQEIHPFDTRGGLYDASDYMLRTYASPSDLDTGLYITDASRVDEALRLVRDQIVRLRDSWTEKDSVLQDIVSDCNDVRNQTVSDLQAAGLDVVSLVFIANQQADQDIELVTASDDVDCPHNKCTKVSLGDTHSIFISDNSGLVFQKGHNIADFHLTRAKWAVAAEVTRADGSMCVVNCPAELIDVAAPRALDTKTLYAATKGLQFMKTKIYAGRSEVTLLSVNLEFQMLDVIEMILQAKNGASDPKIGKRIHRLVMMITMKNIDEYNAALVQKNYGELKLYDAFIVTSRWQDLMLTDASDTDLVDCVRYIESLEQNGEIQLDTQLLQHLFVMRDVYVARERKNAELFSARGGKNGDRNILAGLACIGVTMMMGLFPR
jgi:hypothetical protein